MDTQDIDAERRSADPEGAARDMRDRLPAFSRPQFGVSTIELTGVKFTLQAVPGAAENQQSAPLNWLQSDTLADPV